MGALAAALARVGIALWIGAVAAIAFVSAPLVFGAVPEIIASKDLAARVAGPAFARVDLFGIAAALVALGAIRLRGGSRWRTATLIVLLGCAALDAFLVAPRVEARADPLATWHGLAVGLWMTILVGGILLLAAGVVPGRRKGG